MQCCYCVYKSRCKGSEYKEAVSSYGVVGKVTLRAKENVILNGGAFWYYKLVNVLQSKRYDHNIPDSESILNMHLKYRNQIQLTYAGYINSLQL